MAESLKTNMYDSLEDIMQLFEKRELSPMLEKAKRNYVNSWCNALFESVYRYGNGRDVSKFKALYYACNDVYNIDDIRLVDDKFVVFKCRPVGTDCSVYDNKTTIVLDKITVSYFVQTGEVKLDKSDNPDMVRHLNQLYDSVRYIKDHISEMFNMPDDIAKLTETDFWKSL